MTDQSFISLFTFAAIELISQLNLISSYSLIHMSKLRSVRVAIKLLLIKSQIITKSQNRTIIAILQHLDPVGSPRHRSSSIIIQHAPWRLAALLTSSGGSDEGLLGVHAHAAKFWVISASFHHFGHPVIGACSSPIRTPAGPILPAPASSYPWQRRLHRLQPF